MTYLSTITRRNDTEAVRKITRYPSGWFVTTTVKMYGPFRSKPDAENAVKAANFGGAE